MRRQRKTVQKNPVNIKNKEKKKHNAKKYDTTYNEVVNHCYLMNEILKRSILRS